MVLLVKLSIILSEKLYSIRKIACCGLRTFNKSSDEYGVYTSHSFLNHVIGIATRSITPDTSIIDQK